MIKRILNIINDIGREIIQIAILILCICLVCKIDGMSIIMRVFKEQPLDFSNITYYALANTSNIVIGFFLAGAVLLYFRKLNREAMLNRGNCYHQYYYWWYWICAKILGYKECCLVLVPIPMQYKLLIRDTFDLCNIGNIEYPEKSFDVTVDKYNFKPEEGNNEINLILTDTYPIMLDQIPIDKRAIPTLEIKQERIGDYTRVYNRDFVDIINNDVRALPDMTTVNIFATTNPKHNYEIIQGVFKQANRGNIKSLYVYHQSKDGVREFYKRTKIY